jgi:uncharacterized protein
LRVKKFTANDARALLLFNQIESGVIGGPAEIGLRLYGSGVAATPDKRAARLLGMNAMLRLELQGLVFPVPRLDEMQPRRWALTRSGQERLSELFPPLQDVDTEAGFDCQTCGACCSYFAVISLEAFSNEPGLGIDLQDYDDYSKLPPSMLAFEPMPEGSLLPPNVVLRTQKVGKWHQCLGLEGRVGESCRCSVYEARPLTCSDFEVGGVKCLKSRESRGLSIREAE